MRKLFLFLSCFLVLGGCGPAATNIGKAVEDLLHLVTLAIFVAAVAFAVAAIVQLVRERRAPKRRWYVPVIALATVVPMSLLAGAFWSHGFAPKAWSLSSSDVPYLWTSTAGTIALAVALPFFTARSPRRVIWLVGGMHGVFGYVALVVHCVSAGGAAFGSSEIADVQTAGTLTCVLSKKGALACTHAGIDLMQVQPLSTMAVRSDRVCGIGREHHTVWCADFGANGPGEFWKLDGVDDAEKIVLDEEQGCVVRRGERVSCFVGTTIDDTREARDVALGDGMLCTIDTSDRATCGSFVVEDVKSIAAGDHFACAVRKNGEVACSGGPIDTESLRDVDQIAAGETHVCVRQGGTVRCGGWGSQVGVGDLDVPHPEPMAVALPGRAVDIHATSTTSCATLDDGAVYCWGRTAFVRDMEWCGFLATALCTTRPSRVTLD